MGYQRSDNRYGGERWRGRDEGRYQGGFDQGRQERGDYGARYRDEDRGFFDRAGDEVRSWFGDDEAERRREADQRRWERESSSRDNDWNRDRGDWGRTRASGFGDRSGTSGFEGRFAGYGDRFSSSDRGETWGGGHYGARDFSRGREDRHPLSGAYGTRGHDPHYSEWRNRQIESLDRDYDDYRREHQSKFDQEFAGWREKRQGQRQAVARAKEHMEVLGSDGQKVGTVDKVKGDRIILTRNDETAGGQHHSIPCSWVDQVEDKVTLNKTAEQARASWTNEENERALFERRDQGEEGPHVLDRSFSGTYER